MCSSTFLKIHRKTAVPKSLFNKVAGLKATCLQRYCEIHSSTLSKSFINRRGMVVICWKIRNSLVILKHDCLSAIDRKHAVIRKTSHGGSHHYNFKQWSYLGTLVCLRPATLLKKRLWHKCFPVNFGKFLRIPFL